MKLVPIQHPNCGVTYFFKTNYPLRKGDVVRCQTSNGQTIGVCLSDAFEISESGAKFILPKFGTKLERLQPIIGIYTLMEFTN